MSDSEIMTRMESQMPERIADARCHKRMGLKNGTSITRCLNNKSFIAGGYHFVLYSDEMFDFLSNEDNRFEYLCECYKENK